MQLIIVQGAPGTGKSTLAARLARGLHYPIFMRDAYKEERYDQLAKKPHLMEYARIENDSWQTLYAKVRAAIRSNNSLIIESNFKAKQRKELQKLLSTDSSVIEIYCFAKGWLPFKRYTSRNRQGGRHKSHRDNLWSILVFWETLIAQIGIRTYRPLRLSDNVLEVDTTDFTRVDYDRILNYISMTPEEYVSSP